MNNRAAVIVVSLLVFAMGSASRLRGQEPLLAVERAVNLCWPSKSNHLYAVEYQADPTGFEWLPAIPSIRSVSSNTCAFNLATGPQKYYVVREFPPPTNMIWIEPGTFTMGSPDEELDRGSQEGPQTLVRITRGYWMGKYEVTQADYTAVMGSNPSLFTGDPNRPVERVTWFDCTNYCYELTIRERNAGRLPSDYAYRLPTEAEWEYACRAGTSTRFSFGNDLDYYALNSYAWHCYNECNLTRPVGGKLPNPWGLHDLSGNVWEYVQDWYVDSLPGGSVTDPTGPATGSLRVFRGGSWNRFARECRSAQRARGAPENAFSNFGFRAVLAPL